MSSPTHTSIGALSAPATGIVTSITTAEQHGTLTEEDGAAIFKAATDTKGGQKQNWINIGIGVGSGLLLGYLLGKAF